MKVKDRTLFVRAREEEQEVIVTLLESKERMMLGALAISGKGQIL